MSDTSTLNTLDDSVEQPAAQPPTRTRRLRFTIAGTTGGAGTTTMAALLATTLTARIGLPPKIVDHSGGDLITRVTAASPNAEHWVHDLGPHATTNTDLLANPDTCPVIVATPDPDSADTALFVLQRLAATHGQAVLDNDHVERAVIVINSTSPLKPPDVAVDRLSQVAPGAAIIAVPWDFALARPGPIDPALLAPDTIQALAHLMRSFAV